MFTRHSRLIIQSPKGIEFHQHSQIYLPFYTWCWFDAKVLLHRKWMNTSCDRYAILKKTDLDKNIDLLPSINHRLKCKTSQCKIILYSSDSFRSMIHKIRFELVILIQYPLNWLWKIKIMIPDISKIISIKCYSIPFVR